MDSNNRSQRSQRSQKLLAVRHKMYNGQKYTFNVNFSTA